MNQKISESIFSNGRVVIPMADVNHVEHVKDRFDFRVAAHVVMNGTKWNAEHHVWENSVYLVDEEVQQFVSAWCKYRSEYEAALLGVSEPEVDSKFFAQAVELQASIGKALQEVDLIQEAIVKAMEPKPKAATKTESALCSPCNTDTSPAVRYPKRTEDEIIKIIEDFNARDVRCVFLEDNGFVTHFSMFKRKLLEKVRPEQCPEF